MKTLEILPVVKEENRREQDRCITVDWHGQFALQGPTKDGRGQEVTWIHDDMTGVIVGDLLVVESLPYEAKILGKVL